VENQSVNELVKVTALKLVSRILKSENGGVIVVKMFYCSLPHIIVGKEKFKRELTLLYLLLQRFANFSN